LTTERSRRSEFGTRNAAQARADIPHVIELTVDLDQGRRPRIPSALNRHEIATLALIARGARLQQQAARWGA
jgi:hypothetical protein